MCSSHFSAETKCPQWLCSAICQWSSCAVQAAERTKQLLDLTPFSAGNKQKQPDPLGDNFLSTQTIRLRCVPYSSFASFRCLGSFLLSRKHMTSGCLKAEELHTRAALLHAFTDTDQINKGQQLYQGSGERKKNKERFPIWFYFKNKKPTLYQTHS